MHDDPALPDSLWHLDAGERAAIALAHELGAGLLLLDDRAGAFAARGRGFRVTGTVGVLIDAARQELLSLDAAFTALRATNFRFPPALFDTLLKEHRRRIDGEPTDGA